MRRLALILTLLVLSIACFASLVWDQEVAIRQGVNIEWFHTGIETHDGGTIYVWSDTKLGERDLWAQKVDAQGNLVWGEPVLIDGKPDRQEDPTITRTSDNHYIIAWIDFFDDPDGSVYAQKINAQGELLWQDGGVPVCVVPGVQLAINMEADEDGGAFLVWMDDRNPSKDIYGQRLNASGEPMWALNGIPIADGIGDESQNTMLPDGAGGMMIGYTYNYSNDEDVYVKRFLGDGTMAWDEPLALATGDESQGKVRMAAIGNGEFIFTWQDQTGSDPNIMAQKVNLAGDAVWPQNVAVFSDLDAPQSAPQENPRIVGTSDNAAIIVWEDKRGIDSLDPDLYAQKISSSGQLLWNPDGVPLSTAEFAQFGARMASDGAGGCYVVWDDRRNGNTPNEDIYAQHLSATGQALWEAGGKAICTAGNTQEGGLVKVSGDHIFINWMDIRDGSVGIYYQVLDASGQILLEENGKEVFWGLSGDAPKNNYLILPRSNDTVIIWQDTRYANLGYQIFFQFLNPDGTVALETNGRSVTAQTGYDQSNPHAVVTSDGHIYVIWEDSRHDDPKIYMQLLSPTGERLWGDTGQPLTDSSPINQEGPKLSYDETNDRIYVGWSNADEVGSGFPLHTWGQMFQNGQKMWGPDGVIISDLDDASLPNECSFFEVIEGYYVWQYFISGIYNQFVYVKRVDENGQTYPGWPDEGIGVSDRDGFDINQLLPKLAKTDSGIFVMYKDDPDDTMVTRYFGQHFSADGERLWGPDGVELAYVGNEQDKAVLLKGGPLDSITFAWDENIDGAPDILMQRYSLDGNPIWDVPSLGFIQKPGDQTTADIVSFDNNGILVAWADYPDLEADIYYKYLNPNGSPVAGSNPDGDVVCDALKSQYDPKLAVLNDHAFAVWADGRSSGKTEILGLYAQKLGNITTANDDDHLPSPNGFKLIQNHPNPFNPSTYISFEITDASKDYSLDIYNIKGQLVKTLHQGKLDIGRHSLVWDGHDKHNNLVASGVYFYRLNDGLKSQSRKMLLMK